MKRREPSYTVRCNEKWFSHYGEQDGDSLKTKIELPYDPGIPFLGIYSEKILHSKIYTHPNV